MNQRTACFRITFAILLTTLTFVLSDSAQADLYVPPMGKVTIPSNANVNMACTNVSLNSEMGLNPNAVLEGVRNMSVNSNGILSVDQSMIQLAEKWLNQGKLVLNAGQIVRVDTPTCKAQGAIGSVLSMSSASPEIVPSSNLYSTALLTLLLLISAWFTYSKSRYSFSPSGDDAS